MPSALRGDPASRPSIAFDCARILPTPWSVFNASGDVAWHRREMIEAFNAEMRFFVGQIDPSTILLMLNEDFYALADRRLKTSLIGGEVKFVQFV